MKSRRLALRVCSHSILMILAVYLVMQMVAYLSDNATVGITSLADMPAYVGSFMLMYVLPPMVIFGSILFLYALPLQRILVRLESGQAIDEATAERTRKRMLSFSRLVLVLNLLGFALGFAIMTLVEVGLAGFADRARLVVLLSNLAGGTVYAFAQSALNDLAFARLRDLLGIRAIGSRKRNLRAAQRQAFVAIVLAAYMLLYMQFNMRTLTAFQELETETLRAVQSGAIAGSDAASAYRGRVLELMPSMLSRPGFDPESVPLPWETEASREDAQFFVFLVNALFMLAIASVTQTIMSRGTRDQVEAIAVRLRDVVEGGGDLRTRLSLRAMDEYGELAELVNRLLDRFRDLVGRIAAAAGQTRDGASAIARVLSEAEEVSASTGKAVLDLTASLETEAADSRSLALAIESFRAAAGAVAESVERQLRFATETAAAMEQMSANIRSVETMTTRSGSLTAELSGRGKEGEAAVAEMGAAIAAIETSTAEVLKVLGSLSKIAGDTNMLAMNAAIEAAHAGAQGEGFAVVADEVRSLASNAARQTKAIKDLVAAMSERVRRGVASSTASGEAIRGLSGGIGQAASISREIEEAMREQAVGTKSVEDSLVQVVEASNSIKSSMDRQEEETLRMSASLHGALDRLSALALSSKAQADAVRALEASFMTVKREVDLNMAAVEGLDRELTGFKV